MLQKLKDRYNLEVDTSEPKVAYRETITQRAEGHYRHKKQTGGAGQFGEVYLRLEPLERGEGFQFVNQVVGGTIPSQFIPAVEKGVRQVMQEGCIAGYPMQDIRVCVYDGKHHPVDSKEVAFVTAAKRAFRQAIHQAGPVLLEPVARLRITAPSEHMGDITGELSSKRGRVVGTDMLGADLSLITAEAPLSELASFQNHLRSITAGQGSFTIEPSHDEPMPAHEQQKIVAQYQPKQEED